MTRIDRDSLIADYAHIIVEGMDMDTIVSFAYDTLCDKLRAYSDERLIEEITECSPELLENVTP